MRGIQWMTLPIIRCTRVKSKIMSISNLLILVSTVSLIFVIHIWNFVRHLVEILSASTRKYTTKCIDSNSEAKIHRLLLTTKGKRFRRWGNMTQKRFHVTNEFVSSYLNSKWKCATSVLSTIKTKTHSQVSRSNSLTRRTVSILDPGLPGTWTSNYLRKSITISFNVVFIDFNQGLRLRYRIYLRT